ncbi:hypothetical protein LTR53_004567 [Teratosphaeriaceae sp. CCFEE 6253]|nr:hypothetical protein LTR53_004567 [Teratosphaeriaceae sp. CCFEE 6253]
MAIFGRLSQTFWFYLSPPKTDSQRTKTKTSPRTAPAAKSKTRALGQNRRASLGDVVKQSRSMSPLTRIDSWRVGSAGAGIKRKRSTTPSSSLGAGRQSKVGRMEMEHDFDDEPVKEIEVESDVEMDDDQGEEVQQSDEGIEIEDDAEDAEEDNSKSEESGAEDEDEDEEEEDDDDDGSIQDLEHLTSSVSAARISSKSPSSSHKSFFYDDDFDQDTTIVRPLPSPTYTPPARRKIIDLPAEYSSRGVSTEELELQGWSASHIALVQKLAQRGFEPLVPRSWRRDFTWLPDGLLQPVGDDDQSAFISSVRTSTGGTRIRGIKALLALFEIGGRVRDRLIVNNNLTPEKQSQRSIQAYLKWANVDADLDTRAAIPVLAFEVQPAGTDVGVIQENARRKMARLHEQWAEALRAQPSIEHSPTPKSRSHASSSLTSYPIPQIYALVASHTLLALVAYRPDSNLAAGEQEVRTVAYFDLKDKDYDAWNALAMAIVVCHLRNVRIGMRDATGVGVKIESGMEVEDPDL